MGPELARGVHAILIYIFSDAIQLRWLERSASDEAFAGLIPAADIFKNSECLGFLSLAPISRHLSSGYIQYHFLIQSFIVLVQYYFCKGCVVRNLYDVLA